MTFRAVILTTLLVAAGTGGAARADLVWQFTDTNGVQQSGFTLNSIGATVDIQLYLVASGSDLTTLNNNGLASAGIRLNYSAKGVANVASTSNITPAPAFDDVGPNDRLATSTFSSLNEAVFANSPPTPTNNRILIGTFRFTDINNGTITVTTADPHPSLDDTRTGNNIVLDSRIQNASITITAVPEPGALVLGGLATIGAGGAVWRRRRTTA
jgi:hypothetical protein